MIISTGIATEEDIKEAIEACHQVGNYDVTLLKCTSQYPARVEDANIATMVDLKTRFGVKIGLSDHSMGSDVPVVAVSLGATVVEKHFIIDREIGGPDASFSMTPDEFTDMVTKIRNVEKIIGIVDYSMTESKLKSRHFARSLFVTKSMKKGDVFSDENVRSIRPGNGISPKHFDKVMGKCATQDISYGTPLKFEHF